MILQCDASLKGLGTCILQDNKPIAFTSKSLTDTETRYANIEWELLAIVFGCKKFHTYLYSRSFVVESDHKPLEMICLKNLISAPVHLQRMLLRLQQYDMIITYQPGKEMLLADTLSCLPLRANNSEIKLDLRVDAISFAAFLSSRVTKTAQEMQKDPILLTVHWLTLNGWPNVWRHVPRTAHNYWDFRDKLSIEGDLLMKGERIVIPTSCRDSILADLHKSHEGTNRSLFLARTCMYWPGMEADMMDYIKWCVTCIDNAKMPVETLHPHEVPAGPWIKVGMDLFQDDSGQKFLIIADYFSKFPFILSCCINSPPNDTEIPERSVFNRRCTICCDDQQWTTLQQWRIQALHKRIRLQAPDILIPFPSIEWIHWGHGKEGDNRIQEDGWISKLSSKSPVAVTQWHANR